MAEFRRDGVCKECGLAPQSHERVAIDGELKLVCSDRSYQDPKLDDPWDEEFDLVEGPVSKLFDSYD